MTTTMTPRQIELIKATVPVLREHGVALTTHFYKRMLSGNPELRNVFNTAHQARGQQQKALAMAVLAYAENIENPAVLMPAVRHIAVKHCTIGIRAEHYAIVGRHLLASIKEVLGDAASDELIDAWAAAYAALADLLVSVESGIYAEQTATENSWSGWRPFKVASRTDETPDVVSFDLVPADGGSIPSYKPGQFISVRAYLKDRGIVQPRQYTASRAWAPGRGLRISVKRVPGADGAEGAMSSHLHKYLKEGDVIDVSAPTGLFWLEDKETPVVLLSAGIGITPMAAMLDYLAQTSSKRRVVFIHCSHDKDHVPLKREIHENMQKLANGEAHIYLTVMPEGPACTCMKPGRLDAQKLAALGLDKNSDVYLCGPVGFMNDVQSALASLGFAKEQIHSEVFGTGTMQ